MARRAGDWLSLTRAKSELRLPASVGDYDRTILGQIDEAVSFAAIHTGLPLVNRTTFLDVYPRIPFYLSETRGEHAYGIPFLTGVVSLKARTSLDGAHDQDITIGGASVLEAMSPARFPIYRYWPDVEIPSSAVSIRVGINVGMKVTDPGAKVIRSGVILILRDMFDGHTVAEKKPAWERMLDRLTSGANLT